MVSKVPDTNTAYLYEFKKKKKKALVIAIINQNGLSFTKQRCWPRSSIRVQKQIR